MKVLSKFSIPDYPWIETGTFKGDTSLFLSRISDQVITIEPDTKLYQSAAKRFMGNDSITVIHGESETELRKVTSAMTTGGNFWLDGHYSGEGTYQGSKVFPLNEELAAIEILLNKGFKVALFIDDVSFLNRLTNPDVEERYLDTLVSWLQRFDMDWTIENDIFVIKN